jgi:Pyruvate/2-oxoacid:ferredoxin oxidoreductase delta subunit
MAKVKATTEKDSMSSLSRPPMKRQCERVEPRQKKKARSPKRSGIAAVEAVFTEDEAVTEARRCFGSRDCTACEVCSLICPDLCITYADKTGEPLIDLEFCKGCGLCACLCPKGAITMVVEERK